LCGAQTGAKLKQILKKRGVALAKDEGPLLFTRSVLLSLPGPQAWRLQPLHFLFLVYGTYSAPRARQNVVWNSEVPKCWMTARFARWFGGTSVRNVVESPINVGSGR
jgi:hypothetical protein